MLADQITVIDLGKVIAEGTSDQLKDQIGGEVLELMVENTSQTAEAAEALRGLGTGEPNVDTDEGRIRLPVGTEGAAALRDSSHRMDERQIKLSGFAVHRPTLDDVFMALTGHGAEDGLEPEQNWGSASAARRRRKHERHDRSIDCPARPFVGVGAKVSRAISNGLLVTRRNMLTLPTRAERLHLRIVQPIMFVVLFRFIYANNIANLGALDYVQFLMPGIFVQNAIFGSTTTAIGLAEDMKKGLIDRFRSLPMARSAVLIGRTTFDLVKNMILVAIVLVIGYIFGFRFENGFINACWMIVLVMAVGFTFSWISACIGLSLKQVEAVQAASFTWIFPVVFVSSAFVPVVGMAPFFQVIARHNPVTHFCNLARYLALGPQGNRPFHRDPRRDVPLSDRRSPWLWIVGLLLIFVPLAIRLYRRLT